ncbi:MAG TPA: universal stress protein [Polyangiaceae bacterium]|nr:universal stress protein [Polyangiaceae bacterium]
MFKNRKILVPVDFSSCSKTALEHALALAALTGAQIDLLYVWEPPPFEGREPRVHVNGEASTLQDYALTQSRTEMDKFIAGVPEEQRKRLQAHYEVGRPRERILDHATRGYDLVVMGTHGRTGRARALAGSVAESIVRGCVSPVLTVREH